jgi:hypothetical protein
MLNDKNNHCNNIGVASIDEFDMDNEHPIGINDYGITICSIRNAPYDPDFEINNPSIDLDMYVSGYTGLMRINRLLFLAEHCPLLRIDALRLSLNYIMETFNTQLYTSVYKQLTDALSKL